MSVDGTTVFSVHLDEIIDFGLQRYADAYMDYALFKGSDMNYNRCYKLPNNKLKVYGKESAEGRIQVRTGDNLKVLVEAVDANGNRAVLPFTLHGADATEAANWKVPNAGGQFRLRPREHVIHRDRELHPAAQRALRERADRAPHV